MQFFNAENIPLMTIQKKNFKFNISFPEDTFTLDFPEGINVMDFTSMMEQFVKTEGKQDVSELDIKMEIIFGQRQKERLLKIKKETKKYY